MTRQPTSRQRVLAPVTRMADIHVEGVTLPEGEALPTATTTPDAVVIERLILHSLNNATGKLLLVNEEAQLDERSEAYFADHVTSALRRADWRARFERAESEIPQLCRRLFAGAEDFVASSRALAEKLFVQMGKRAQQITPGDFVVIVFHFAGAQERHIALLKLDPDDQRLIREYRVVGERLTVRISIARNLLPESRRLQKCALLRPTAGTSGVDEFAVTLLDTQAGPRSDGVAAFFYRGFLNVTLEPSARRRTRLFLSCTESWLAQRAASFTPAQLLLFYRARRDALRADAVRLAVFARAALDHDAALQESLISTLSTALSDGQAEGPVDAFAVDRTVAETVTRVVTLELDGGAQVKVDAARFDELVTVDGARTAESKIRLTLESLTLREVVSG
jgi:37-kD nucleoid-associated bacterial protein